MLTIGTCIDPTLPELLENLQYVIALCSQRDIVLYVQTKNPEKFTREDYEVFGKIVMQIQEKENGVG